MPIFKHPAESLYDPTDKSVVDFNTPILQRFYFKVSTLKRDAGAWKVDLKAKPKIVFLVDMDYYDEVIQNIMDQEDKKVSLLY